MELLVGAPSKELISDQDYTSEIDYVVDAAFAEFESSVAAALLGLGSDDEDN